jgi:hypothetical protein
MAMICKARLDDAFDPCRGLTLFHEKSFVVIENEEICQADIYRVIYRKQLEFKDGSMLNYDTPMFCGDEKVLKQVAQALSKKFEV